MSFSIDSLKGSVRKNDSKIKQMKGWHWYEWQQLLYEELILLSYKYNTGSLQMFQITSDTITDALYSVSQRNISYFGDQAYVDTLKKTLSSMRISDIFIPNDISSSLFQNFSNVVILDFNNRLTKEELIMVIYNLPPPTHIKEVDLLFMPVLEESPSHTMNGMKGILRERLRDLIMETFESELKNMDQQTLYDQFIIGTFNDNVVKWQRAYESSILSKLSGTDYMKPYSQYAANFVSNTITPPKTWFEYITSNNPLHKSQYGSKPQPSQSLQPPQPPQPSTLNNPPTTSTSLPSSSSTSLVAPIPFPSTTAIPLPPGSSSSLPIAPAQPIPTVTANEVINVDDSSESGSKRPHEENEKSADSESELNLNERAKQLKKIQRRQADEQAQQQSPVPQPQLVIPTGEEMNQLMSMSVDPLVDMNLTSSGSSTSTIIINEHVKFAIPKEFDSGSSSNSNATGSVTPMTPVTTATTTPTASTANDPNAVITTPTRTPFRYQGPFGVTKQDETIASEENPFGVLEFRPHTLIVNLPGVVTMNMPKESGSRSNRMVYTGQWKYGMWHGQGTLTFPYKVIGQVKRYDVSIHGNFTDGFLHGECFVAFTNSDNREQHRTRYALQVYYVNGEINTEYNNGVADLEIQVLKDTSSGHTETINTTHQLIMVNSLKLFPDITFKTYLLYVQDASLDYVQSAKRSSASVSGPPLSMMSYRLIRPMKSLTEPPLKDFEVGYRQIEGDQLETLKTAFSHVGDISDPQKYEYHPVKAVFEIVNSRALIQFHTNKVSAQNDDIITCERSTSNHISTSVPTITNAMLRRYPNLFTLTQTKLPRFGRNEQYLFHQTKYAYSIPFILSSRFDHSLIRGVDRFGAGSYFADNMVKSAMYGIGSSSDQSLSDLYDFLKLPIDPQSYTNAMIGARVSLGCSLNIFEVACPQPSQTYNDCSLIPSNKHFKLSDSIQRPIATDNNKYTEPLDSLAFTPPDEVIWRPKYDPNRFNNKSTSYNEYIVRNGYQVLPTHLFIYDQDLKSSKKTKNDPDPLTAIAR